MLPQLRKYAVAALLVVLAAAQSGSTTERHAKVEHDLHVSYGYLAVEANIAMLRIRFFKDDLEWALRPFSEDPGIELSEETPEYAIFLSCLEKHFSIRSGKTELSATIVGSGEDVLDREPVWWYLVQFDAPETIESLEVRNTLLLDLFADQKNILKVAHFPDDIRRSYYFARGEETATIDFW